MSILLRLGVIAALGGFLGLSAAVANAARPGFELNMKVNVQGQGEVTPRVITPAGEMASISTTTGHNQTFVEVVATESRTNNGILMKFVVGHVDSTGHRTIVSKPTIMAMENEEAQIQVGDRDRNPDVTLSVVATRKQL